MVQGRSSPLIPTSRVAHRSTKVLTILPSYVVGAWARLPDVLSRSGHPEGAGLSLVGLGTVASSDPSAAVNSG
jgi:hypothetical protein